MKGEKTAKVLVCARIPEGVRSRLEAHSTKHHKTLSGLIGEILARECAMEESMTTKDQTQSGLHGWSSGSFRRAHFSVVLHIGIQLEAVIGLLLLKVEQGETQGQSMPLLQTVERLNAISVAFMHIQDDMLGTMSQEVAQ